MTKYTHQYNCDYCMHRRVCKFIEYFIATCEEFCSNFAAFSHDWRTSKPSHNHDRHGNLILKENIMKKTVYLGGAINGCTDSECNDWREYATKKLDGFEIKNPMVRDYRGREHECINEIVELDKADIDQSDVLLMYCPKPSWGTGMEIFYGFTTGKMVYCVNDSGKPSSPWFIYHSDKVFNSIDDAISFILGVGL